MINIVRYYFNKMMKEDPDSFDFGQDKIQRLEQKKADKSPILSKE